MRGFWRHRHRHHHHDDDYPCPLFKGTPQQQERFRVMRYFRARLHRKMFMAFGATILFTGFSVSTVMFLLHGSWGHARASGGLSKVVIMLTVACSILWAISGKMARRIARPLAEVARVARDIGQGRLESRAALSRHMPDEVGLLAESINDMAARIERQLRDQRMLLATVSHELRTPLGHLRIISELIRTNGSSDKTIDDLEREILEIDTLVGELLASSRLDFSITSPQTLDAVDVARRSLERAAVTADRLELAPNGSFKFEADPTLLGRALANLLDNAKKHGGGVTALRVSTTDDVIRFEVEDCGPGIGANGAASLFEPFYKSNGGAQTAENGSLGLGLSLVKRIAEAHGGRAFVEQRVEGGSRIGLEVKRDNKPATN